MLCARAVDDVGSNRWDGVCHEQDRSDRQMSKECVMLKGFGTTIIECPDSVSDLLRVEDKQAVSALISIAKKRLGVADSQCVDFCYGKVKAIIEV